MDEQPDRDPRPGVPGEEPARSDDTRNERLAAIRAAVERDLDDVRSGRVADLDAALDRIERMLDEIEAAKRG